MPLSVDEVRKIAHLARLEIAEDDISNYAAKLSNILELAAKMDSVDARHVTPMAHPLNASQRLRDDVVTEQNERDLFQQQAPQVEEGLFLVPKVIE